MPKKQPRNAFYFFMLDHKEEQRQKGIHYQNLTEVQLAADPLWRDLRPSDRAKYEKMAKAEREKIKGGPMKKYTSNGVAIADVEAEQRRLQEMEEYEIEQIKNFVLQKSISKTLIEADIFLIDVNAYCFCSTHYFMAESTVLRFSLLEGIKDTFHKILEPGPIPIGYASDVKLGAMELGLEMPVEENPRTDFPQVLAYLMDYLKQNSRGRVLPPLYTLPEKVERVKDFIRQLCISSGVDDSQLPVYRLDTLFFHLTNAIQNHSEEGFPKISLAVAQLKKDPHKYTPGLACEVHEASDRSVECSRSRAQRWAYTVLDKCCPVADVRMQPGRHLPHGVDIESVISYKESKKESLRSGAPSTVGASSCSSSVFEESFDTTFGASASASSVWAKPKPPPPRTQEPLRLPKTDYSQTFRQAPELTESNFPSLGMGRGRGNIKGVARSLDKMSLNKK